MTAISAPIARAGHSLCAICYVLARNLGLPDADCARGKMAALWRQCLLQRSCALESEMVRAILGDDGIDGLVKSGLGFVSHSLDDCVVIRGLQNQVSIDRNLRLGRMRGPAAPRRRAADGGGLMASVRIEAHCARWQITPCDLKHELLQTLGAYADALGLTFLVAFREAFAQAFAQGTAKGAPILPVPTGYEPPERG